MLSVRLAVPRQFYSLGEFAGIVLEPWGGRTRTYIARCRSEDSIVGESFSTGGCGREETQPPGGGVPSLAEPKKTPPRERKRGWA